MTSKDGASTVCLIGMSSSGKTLMALSAMEAMRNRRYGYPQTRRPLFRQVGGSTRLDALRAEWQSGAWRGTSLSALDTFDLDLHLDGDAGVRHHVRTRIIDAAGGHTLNPSSLDLAGMGLETAHLTRGGGGHAGGRVASDDDTETFERPETTGAAATEAKEKLIAEIARADGLVMVLPICNAFRDNEVNWEWVGDLVAWLRQDRGPVHSETSDKRPRVVLAFTRYERLFTRLGPDAATVAGLRQVMEPILAGMLERTELRNELEPFASRYDIRVIATSSYGFVPNFGNPNLDPSSPDNEPFRNAAGIRQLYGFLTADPFVFAATGIDNPFLFPLRWFLPERPSPGATSAPVQAPPPPSPEPRAKPQSPGIFGELLNFFNANHEDDPT